MTGKDDKRRSDSDGHRHGGDVSVEKGLVARAHDPTVYRLWSLEETPTYLRANRYILSAYRVHFSLSLCAQSVLRVHNETGNIWTHLLATAGALLLTVHALAYGLQHAPLLERVFMGVYGLSAVFCFATSTVFHTFLCHSRVACERLSKLDYMGIALVLGGAFFPGIYYGFTCQPHLQLLYLSLITATVALIVAALRSPRFYAYEMFLWRLGIFSTLAAFGVIPMVHWVVIRGSGHPEVTNFLWRLVVMFGLLMAGTAVYVLQIPERWAPGRFDIWFHSHQWWHLLVAATFVWHFQTAVLFSMYRNENPCDLGGDLGASAAPLLPLNPSP